MAQFTGPFAFATFMNTCTWGFRQSTSVTIPFSVTGLWSSNFARISWCAVSGAGATKKPSTSAVSTEANTRDMRNVMSVFTATASRA